MDKNNIKISVIMPVYNAEKYLARALDSLVLQTYENLEIICVNDGSKDGSAKILEDYAKRDKRIKIINQENQGAGAARNKGMTVMSGDYFTFIDSDDWLQLGAYRKFVNIIQKEERDIDILLFNGFIYVNDKDLVSAESNRVSNMDNWGNFKQSHFKTIRENKNPFQIRAIWNRLFRTEWYRQYNFLFMDKMLWEDELFAAQTYWVTDNVYVLEDYLYCYRQQPESLCHTMNENVFDMLTAYDQLRDFYKKNNFWEKHKYTGWEYLLRESLYCLEKCKDDLKEPFLKAVRQRLNEAVQELDQEEYEKRDYHNLSEDMLQLDAVTVCEKYNNFKIWGN